MKNFRTIYEVQAFTNNGDLTMRRFARNKRTAEKIAKATKNEVGIRKLSKVEHQFINIEDVEG